MRCGRQARGAPRQAWPARRPEATARDGPTTGQVRAAATSQARGLLGEAGLFLKRALPTSPVRPGPGASETAEQLILPDAPRAETAAPPAALVTPSAIALCRGVNCQLPGTRWRQRRMCFSTLPCVKPQGPPAPAPPNLL